MLKSIFSLILLALIFFCMVIPGASQAETNVPMMVKNAIPGICIIYALKEDDKINQGTGFFINGKGDVITCFHVINNSKEIMIATEDAYPDKRKRYVNYYPVKNVAEIDESFDLARLEVEIPRGNFSVLPLNCDLPLVGEDVIVISAPQDQWYSVARGIVSQLRIPSRTIFNREIETENVSIYSRAYDSAIEYFSLFSLPEFIQIDAAASQGSSGGPVFNMNGEVIGIIHRVTTAEAQNLNLIIPTRDIAEVIRLIDTPICNSKRGQSSNSGKSILQSYLDAHPDLMTRESKYWNTTRDN